MFIIKPLGRLARFLDWVTIPIMYLLSGTFSEEPQKTHRWNNHHLKLDDVEYLNRDLMVHHDGIPGETSIYPLFHMPVFGGWRNYVVLGPTSSEREWYVGWIAGGVVGVSRIPIRGYARLLIGPGPVYWFGATAKGNQVQIKLCWTDRIGEKGPFAQKPLL